MIVKDLTEFQSEDGKVSLIGLLRAVMKHGFSWKRGRDYQEEFINSIQNILSDKCIILRSLTLPGEENPVPLILISPAGLAVINPRSIEGVYQARDNMWNAIDRAGDLIPSDPNLVQETQSYASAVQKHLETHDFQDVPLESVLAFVSAGTHVDVKHPAVRVLPFDAIKNFARQIGAAEMILDNREKNQLVELLSEPHSPSYSTPYPDQEYSPAPSSQVADISSKVPKSLNKLAKTLNFSKRQWILLGAILIVQVLLLVVFIFLVLLTA